MPSVDEPVMELTGGVVGTGGVADASRGAVVDVAVPSVWARRLQPHFIPHRRLPFADVSFSILSSGGGDVHKNDASRTTTSPVAMPS